MLGKSVYIVCVTGRKLYLDKYNKIFYFLKTNYCYRFSLKKPILVRLKLQPSPVLAVTFTVYLGAFSLYCIRTEEDLQ